MLKISFLFRKVADVKREKELAEKRKNEPQLGTSQDHLVRKIFSKFKRTQQPTHAHKEFNQNDIEKGDLEKLKVITENNAVRKYF